ncbi:hypothetical protein PHLGIDRAFT_124934 [Phlebiopsis gigantea 11061_1 CR5-6]|uniref:Alcohol acetyltransferase n=1 Tax=Phlebiopsis gigantea (strain 11061_1 CR5-6) TaxID=745531 RepID=A0A0C3SCW5_PHLG1|nr:hypothetical protein PHLGIDRAFT_124934 [Phlebiopsis gigantea 11061_1 CR5-6]
MVVESPRQILRQAGPLERFHIDRAEVGFDSCVVVSARYTASGLVLDKNMLYPALAAVALQLAPLSVQIDVPQKLKVAPSFVRLPAIHLDDVVSFVEDDGSDFEKTLSQLMEAQLAQRFELGTSTPLWRLVVVSGHTVVFAYYHGIGDGQSSMAFHRALVLALNTSTGTVTPAISEGRVDISENVTSLKPAVEKLMDVSPTFPIFCGVLYDTFAPGALTKASSAWTGNPVTRRPSVQTNVRLWEISATDAAHLLQLCRHHKTTLTGFFHTLLVGVLSKHVAGLALKKKYKRLSTLTPLSLRRYTGTSPYEMCLEVSVFHFYPRISPFSASKTAYADFPWSDSAQTTAKFHSKAEHAKRSTGMAKFIYILGLYQSYWTDNIGKKRESTLALSNLGRFPAPETKGDEKWTVGSMFFAQCDSVTGSALKMNVVGSPNGAVNVGFSWGVDSLDSPFVETVVEDSKAGLAAILASAPAEL